MIGFFTRNPVAANLLMVLMILAGVLALADLNRQFFPHVESPLVGIDVVWPGAGAEDVANRITVPVHHEIRGIDGLDSVVSTTWEGQTRITANFKEGTDFGQALAEIGDRLDAMRTLPGSAEDPVISRYQPYEAVSSLMLTGTRSRGDCAASNAACLTPASTGWRSRARSRRRSRP